MGSDLGRGPTVPWLLIRIGDRESSAVIQIFPARERGLKTGPWTAQWAVSNLRVGFPETKTKKPGSENPGFNLYW